MEILKNDGYKSYSSYKKENQKIYQNVFNYFSDQILTGKLKIGDKIPTEREIAEQLNVSRNSIREVMHMLEINGLLTCIQGSGNYVRCEPLEYMTRFVNMIMALENIDYMEVYHIRRGLETEALKLAMELVSEEEVETMHQLLLKMDQMADPRESAKLDAQFHRCLIHASGNRLIILYASMLQDLMDHFIEDYRVKILADEKSAELLRRSHWYIYDALVDRDVMEGNAAMQKHFDIVKSFL